MKIKKHGVGSIRILGNTLVNQENINRLLLLMSIKLYIKTLLILNGNMAIKLRKISLKNSMEEEL